MYMFFDGFICSVFVICLSIKLKLEGEKRSFEREERELL